MDPKSLRMSRSRTIRACVVFVALLFCNSLWAHESPSAQAMRWSWEPLVVLPIGLATILYLAGTVRMRRRSGRRLSVWPEISYVAGIIALVVALDSPVHLIGGQLFWVHMTQHELLMLLAAPLLVLGRPLVPFLWAVPKATARAISSWTKALAWQSVWSVITAPFVAWLIHAVVLWVWHILFLFQVTLDNN